MGIAATQARLIALTSRMSDLEYQGQQINQQRTTLSQKVNALYTQLTEMEVPTPPSVNDYTEIVYSGADGAETFRLGNVRPDGSQYYRVEMIYTRYGHFMDPGRRYNIEAMDGGGYCIAGDPDRPVISYADAYPDQISEEEDAGYLEAIRASFPDYANATDDEIRNAFMVYLESNSRATYDTPHFFRRDEMILPGGSGYVQSYDYIVNGQYEETVEKAGCRLTFDSAGRIVTLEVPDEDGSSYRLFNLSAESVTNEAAYDDAFNDYEYDKYLYDKKQQDLNRQTEILQFQDKQLELKLTRLDNERNAVKTEMDAVKKVVDENIERSYKTFSG